MLPCVLLIPQYAPLRLADEGQEQQADEWDDADRVVVGVQLYDLRPGLHGIQDGAARSTPITTVMPALPFALVMTII